MIPSVFALLYALFALSMTSPSNDAHSGCFLSQVSLFIYFSEFCDIVLLHCLLTINAKARQREKIVNAHLWVLSILFRTTVYKVVDAHVCRAQEACLQLAKVAEAKVKQNNALEIYSNYFQYEQQDCQVTRSRCLQTTSKNRTCNNCRYRTCNNCRYRTCNNCRYLTTNM